MAQVIDSRRLADFLKAEGYPLPESCAEVRMIVRPTGAILIEYDVLATAELLQLLGRALIAFAEPKAAP
jgi:hypothetical protein